MPQVHPRRARARAVVIAALVSLPVLCLALQVAIDRAYPNWDDHEQAVVMSRLRARKAEFPGRPVEMVFGSSRAMYGFDTDGMSSDAAGPLVLNMSLTGSTPLVSLIQLRRIVAEGHKPRALVLEVLPCWMRDLKNIRQEGYKSVDRYRAADLPTLSRIAPEWAPRLWRDWGAFNVCRWHSLRANLAAEVLPSFAAKDRRGRREAMDRALSPHGCYKVELDPVPPATLAEGLKVASGYEPLLRGLDSIDPVFDAVMEEFFAFCRNQDILLRAVVLTPEGTGFRAFYGPGVQRRMADHLSELCRRNGVPLVDAREWLSDDCFLDGHHMTARGGRTFTQRFQKAMAAVAAQGRQLAARP